MDTSAIINILGNGVYIALGALALFGLFCFVLLWRRIAQKRFPDEATAGDFLADARDNLQRGDYDAVAEMCDTPPFWAMAVPQLMLVAIDNRQLGTPKLRRLLGERFERDVLADLEHRTSWIATVVKSAPMLGLLGTVMGMISAFGKIATPDATGVDPQILAYDISLALNTTAIGLTIAIPLVILGNVIHVRIGKLQDEVQEQLGEFVDDLDAAVARTGPAPRADAGGRT